MRNILICRMHHKFSHDISQLDANFYFWRIDGQVDKWWFPGVPQPPNVLYCGNKKDIDYDVAIVGTYQQALFVKKTLPRLPVIAAIGRGIEANQKLVIETDLIHTLVGGSVQNMRFSTHPRTRVIYRGFDPDVYAGYTGDIPYAISVGNNVSARAELQKEMTDQIVDGLPHSHIGLGCANLPNGIGGLDHQTLCGFYRSCRVLVNTAEPKLSGHSNTVSEAMLTGMPVAITPFADWPLLIVNGESGCVSNDVGLLRGFVERCLGSQAYARKIGAAGRDILLKRFKPEDFVAKWTALLDEICRLEAK